MTIFLFTLAPEGYKELDLRDGQSYADINCLRWNGESKLATWKTPDLVWFTNEFSQGDEQDGDFLKFRGGAPVVTERVKNLLMPLIGNCVEFLPVNIEGETRHLVNITCVLDLMDKSKSTFKVYGDGAIGPCQHAHLKAPDETKPIFKVLGYLPRVFVTQSLQALLSRISYLAVPLGNTGTPKRKSCMFNFDTNINLIALLRISRINDCARLIGGIEVTLNDRDNSRRKNP